MLFYYFSGFLGLIIVFAIIAYWKNTPKRDRAKFNSISQLIQFVFAFVTLWFTVFVIRSNNSDANTLFTKMSVFNKQFGQMASSLQQVSQNLRVLPSQLDSFSKSLNALNATTRKQTSVWQNQQNTIISHYSQKPIIKLIPQYVRYDKDTCIIGSLALKNDGTTEAHITSLLLMIPVLNFVSIDTKTFEYYKNMGDTLVFRCQPESLQDISTISANSGYALNCIIKLRNGCKEVLQCQVSYYGPNGSQTLGGELYEK